MHSSKHFSHSLSNFAAVYGLPEVNLNAEKHIRAIRNAFKGELGE